MRPALVMGLLVLFGTTGCAAKAAQKPPVAVRPIGPVAFPETRNPSWEVDGWGKTVADAERVALEKGCREVRAYLAAQDPALEWAPNEKYVEGHLVKAHAEGEPATKEDPVEGTFLHRTLRIEITAADYQDMLRHARTARVEYREILLAKVLAVLVALLTAVAGYIRLEEATKGYYTALLRLAAVGLVAAVCAGLLCIA